MLDPLLLRTHGIDYGVELAAAADDDGRYRRKFLVTNFLEEENRKRKRERERSFAAA